MLMCDVQRKKQLNSDLCQVSRHHIHEQIDRDHMCSDVVSASSTHWPSDVPSTAKAKAADTASRAPFSYPTGTSPAHPPGPEATATNTEPDPPHKRRYLTPHRNSL